MSEGIIQYVVPSVLGLGGGLISTFLGPWVYWWVEAKKGKQENRKKLLLDLRNRLSNPPSKAEFRKLPQYFQIIHYLSPATVKTIEGEFDENGREIIVVVMGGPDGGANPYVRELLTDLSRIEREWGLI
ncbi:MAG: hypothetical protein WCP60_10255 [bacterium]